MLKLATGPSVRKKVNSRRSSTKKVKTSKLSSSPVLTATATPMETISKSPTKLIRTATVLRAPQFLKTPKLADDKQ